jgi:hypothetical protein
MTSGLGDLFCGINSDTMCCLYSYFSKYLGYILHVCLQLTCMFTTYTPFCLHLCGMTISNFNASMARHTSREKCIHFVVWHNKRLKCKAHVYRCALETSKGCLSLVCFVLVVFCLVPVLFFFSVVPRSGQLECSLHLAELLNVLKTYSVKAVGL